MSHLTGPAVTKYDVAISFAGDDRIVAEAFAVAFRRLGLSVFYDDFEQAELWGKDLYGHLTSVYSDDAKFCLMIISEHYARKQWPTHERRAAQVRAFRENREYILPLRLDDTKIEGVLDTTAYIDYRSVSQERIVELVLEKIASFNAKHGIEFERVLVQDVFERSGVSPKGSSVGEADFTSKCPTCNTVQVLSEATIRLDGTDTVYFCKNGCQPIVVVSRPGTVPWPGRGFRLGDFTVRNAADLYLKTKSMPAAALLPASRAALMKQQPKE